MARIPQLSQAFVDDSVQLLDQALIKIRNCLAQLSDEKLAWRPNHSSNSIGNLVLHICGNFRQWTVSGIGGQPDMRDRDGEFSRSVSMNGQQLLALAEQTVADGKSFLAGIQESDLLKPYRIQGFEVSGIQAINHTVTHFVGHTHQIIYVTRMLLGDQYQFAWSPDDERGLLPI